MKRIFSFFICFCILAAALTVFVSAGTGTSERIVLVLDPGHGGVDTGTAYRGEAEKVKALQLGLALRDRLEATGLFTVYLTRTDDTALSLPARGIYANSVNADALISLHFDGSVNPGDNGVTVITSVLPEYAMTRLGNKICSELCAEMGFSSNGILQKKDTADYYWDFERQWDFLASYGTLSDYYGIPTWCAKFGIPSVLIEHGFYTNSSDVSKIFSDGGIDRLADADARAIIDYYTGHAHTYEASPVCDYPSNCMFTGKQSRHCTVCGHRCEVSYIAAAPDNHFWIEDSESSAPAKCGEDGRIVYKCRITSNLNEKKYPCAEHTKVEYITARPHSFFISDERAVTHTTDGYTQYTCSNCAYSYTDTIYAEGHSWVYSEYIAPTCTEEGCHIYYCSVCGDAQRDVIPAAGHTDTVLSHIDPTCTESGKSVLLCSVCGSEREVILPAAGHSMQVIENIQGSCTEDSIKTTVCSVCGEQNTEKIAAQGHKYETVIKTLASCTEKAHITEKCTVCGEINEAEEPALGHMYSSRQFSEAALYEPGKILTECSRCKMQVITVTGTLAEKSYVKLTLPLALALPIILAAAAVYIALQSAKSAEEKRFLDEHVPQEPTEKQPEESADAAKV